MNEIVGGGGRERERKADARQAAQHRSAQAADVLHPYLSFDIDSLDPAFAPGTGTPEVGGLTSLQALMLLRGLGGIDFIAGDLVEVAPQYDATTNTAQAGAQVLFTIFSLLALAVTARRAEPSR